MVTNHAMVYYSFWSSINAIGNLFYRLCHTCFVCLFIMKIEHVPIYCLEHLSYSIFTRSGFTYFQLPPIRYKRRHFLDFIIQTEKTACVYEENLPMICPLCWVQSHIFEHSIGRFSTEEHNHRQVRCIITELSLKA